MGDTFSYMYNVHSAMYTIHIEVLSGEIKSHLLSLVKFYHVIFVLCNNYMYIGDIGNFYPAKLSAYTVYATNYFLLLCKTYHS